jgi:hypothetical protein
LNFPDFCNFFYLFIYFWVFLRFLKFFYFIFLGVSFCILPMYLRAPYALMILSITCQKTKNYFLFVFFFSFFFLTFYHGHFCQSGSQNGTLQHQWQIGGTLQKLKHWGGGGIANLLIVRGVNVFPPTIFF